MESSDLEGGGEIYKAQLTCLELVTVALSLVGKMSPESFMFCVQFSVTLLSEAERAILNVSTLPQLLII